MWRSQDDSIDDDDEEAQDAEDVQVFTPQIHFPFQSSQVKAVFEFVFWCGSCTRAREKGKTG